MEVKLTDQGAKSGAYGSSFFRGFQTMAFQFKGDAHLMRPAPLDAFFHSVDIYFLYIANIYELNTCYRVSSASSLPGSWGDDKHI